MTQPRILNRPGRSAWPMAAAFLLALAAVAAPGYGDVIDFEDLSLAPNSYWNGSDQSGGFTSGGAHFNNSYDSLYGSWSGWSYSNVNDTVTADYTNQHAAFTGTGVGGSGNYAVAFGYADMVFYGGAMPSITIPAGMHFESMMVTNATYTALSMLNGDTYAKKFGGDTGDDPDWLLLSILGEDAAGNPVGTVDFYLADYRFGDNAQDYVVRDWTAVNLSSLAGATTLKFDITSSDTEERGMNTPAYFAMDNLSVSAVPEPSSLALLGGAGLAAMVCFHRRRVSRKRAAIGPTDCG